MVGRSGAGLAGDSKTQARRTKYGHYSIARDDSKLLSALTSGHSVAAKKAYFFSAWLEAWSGRCPYVGSLVRPARSLWRWGFLNFGET